MNILKIMLVISLVFAFGCTKSEEETPAPAPGIDYVLEITNVMKYFFAGDVVVTDAIYSPQGINFGELLLGKKITKTISIQNSPLFENFPTDIKILEKSPKVFNIESNNCGILKTGATCQIVISANYFDNLFTSTKTARLVIGQKDGADLYLELFGQIRNLNITSNQFESNYSIEMNKSFDTDYAQFVLQERIVTVRNNSATKYLRNDYIVPRLIGQNPTDFYIISNDCMYPIPAQETCDIRVLYKKWKTTNTVPDTELRFPNIVQAYSLKMAQLVTYDPVFSNYGICSKVDICSGVGTQSRTITDCIKNGVNSVAVANCTGTTLRACNSPAGNRIINILGGTQNQSCSEGSTTWIPTAVTCNEDFHDESINCIPDTFIATYSAYSPPTNPYTQVCQGTLNAPRTVTSCKRGHNDEIVSNSKCVDPSPILAHKSPAGNRAVNISNGVQSQSCLEGSDTWLITDVSCNNGFFRSGNTCSPIVYVATFSAYSISPVSTTTCSGQDTVTRTITSCKQQHDNVVVANNLCSDPNASIVINSPEGTRVIDLIDTNTSLAKGTQNQFCSSGSTSWQPINTTCYQYYSNNGDDCVANSLTTPISNEDGTVYSQTASYNFNVQTDLNADALTIYKDPACSQSIGTGISTGNVWNASASFSANVLTSVYAKSRNTYTLQESSCGYLFDYLYDTVIPTATLLINAGATSTTLNLVDLNLSNVTENSGLLDAIEIYENGTCSGDVSTVNYSQDTSYEPLAKGSNLTIGVKLVDAAGNKSACVTDSILFALDINPLYANGANWMSYVTSADIACSGSGACIHGGEKLVTNLDQTSCEGLSLIDNFDFFSWRCEDDPVNSGKVRFISTKINKNKRLFELIDITGVSPVWKNFSVSLDLGGNIVNSSISSPLYTNSLVYASTGCYNMSNVLTSASNYTQCIAEGNSWYIGNPANANYELSGSAGTIFVLKLSDPDITFNEDVKTKGIVLANNIGFVNEEGSTLTTVTNTQQIFSGTNVRYFYIESNSSKNLIASPSSTSQSINLSNADYGFINSGFNFGFFNGIKLTNSDYVTIKDAFSFINSAIGIYLITSTNNTLDGIGSSSNTGSGITLATASNYNLLKDITVANNYGSSIVNGVEFNGSSYNTLVNASISNNQGSGVYGLATSDSNIFSFINVTANGNGGILFNNSKFNKFTAINSSMNMVSSYSMNLSSPSNILHNAFLFNGDMIGFGLGSASNQNFVSQMAVMTITNSLATQAALTFDSSLNNKISGNIYVGVNSRNCVRTNTSSANDATGVTTAATCTVSGLSDFTYYDALNSPTEVNFQTQVEDIDDEENPIPNEFPYLTTEFIRNLSPTRIFMKDDTTFTSTARGRCSSGNCLVFDFGLNNTDTLIRSRSNLPSELNSSPVISTGEICPTEVAGNNILSYAGCYIGASWNFIHKNATACVQAGGTWSSLDTNPGTFSSPKVFLKNAVEIIDPSSLGYTASGNHDGLCETGESCLYTPNFGSYQGDGELTSCQYDPQGGLSNIMIWGYPQNGRQ